jgi:hypothetical protein
MSLLLLQRISARRLPVTVTSPEDVDTIRILKAAGLVEVLFSRALGKPAPHPIPDTAQVLAITPRGWQELEGLAKRIVFGH